jgi:predicted ATPase
LKKPIEFITTFEFGNKVKPVQVEWSFFVDLKDKKWNIQELIRINGKGTISYGNIPIVPDPFIAIKLESSLLKIADNYLSTAESDVTPIIALKEYLSSSNNFELLSPDSMREGFNPSDVQDVGKGGKTLAAFVHSLGTDEKEILRKNVSQIIGFDIEIITVENGKEIELYINENKKKIREITSPHISDGLLRIIAFVAISLQKKTKELGDINSGFMLLDEIENGINPYLTEKIVALLRDVVEKTGRQVVITTHSPVM